MARVHLMRNRRVAGCIMYVLTRVQYGVLLGNVLTWMHHGVLVGMHYDVCSSVECIMVVCTWIRYGMHPLRCSIVWCMPTWGALWHVIYCIVLQCLIIMHIYDLNNCAHLSA